MKRVVCLLLVLVLALGLAACQEKWEKSPYHEEDFNTEGTVILATENRTYDKSVESFTYRISNYGKEDIVYSTGYSIEVKRDGVWYSLPKRKEAEQGTAEMRAVAPGETAEGKFSFLQYDYEVVDGEYRLILTISGKLYTASFSIGAESYDEDPYGYGTLESLPEEIDLETLTYDIAINSGGEIIGGSEEHIITFLEKVNDDTPGMMRIVSYGLSGNPVIYDVEYDGSCFICRKDTTREPSAEQAITQQRYSFLVTDGDYIYLSYQATLDEKELAGRRIEANRFAVLSDSGFSMWDTMVGLVEEMTDKRLGEDATLARYWSEDGSYWVNLTANPKDFTVTSKKYGMSRTLTEFSQIEEERGAEMEIISATWVSQTQVRLNCRLQGNDEETWYATFDVPEEALMS